MSKRILFAVAAVLLAATGIYFRADSTRNARVQADKIVAADAAATDTTAAIASLKDFSAAHMGASASLTLQGSFDRADAAAKAAAAASNNSSQIYAAAQAACGGKSDSVTQAKCNQAYLAARLANTPTPSPVPAPVLSAYQHSFKSPLWTPDLAGALLLGAAAAAGLGLALGRPKKGRS